MPPTGHNPAGPLAAAACSQCHPDTVNADGTINVAGGKHLNGLPDVQGGHSDPLWADPSHHGYGSLGANLTGLTSCKTCHGTDLAGGTSGVSCTACHATAGFPTWDTNCTFCHGNRSTGRQSPPVDIQNRSVTTNVSVGRHDKHVGSTLSAPIPCTACHVARTTSVITDTTHIDGNGIAEVTFAGAPSGLGSYTRTSATASGCAATYCHGNFSGGSGSASVSWVSTTPMTCTSCHGNPPATGEHNRHVNGEGLACSVCHGTGYAQSGTVNVTLHVNGAKNVVTGNGIQTWSRPSCTPSNASACHGTETWP
jgi:predicted CxxxxCH...CXXCH cytochrome family protein